MHESTTDESEARRQSAEVVAHYDALFAAEAERLERHAPVEYSITSRQLRSRIGQGAVVADIGVGVGHYAELLAEHGCELHLVDISRRFLDITRRRLEAAGLAARITRTYLGSATDLQQISDGTCDAVLMLGPLYHLSTVEARRQAVSQAARILKRGGLLFAAGINRLAYFRDLLRDDASAVSARREFHDRFLADGRLTPAEAPTIGFAHLTTVGEFRALFDGFVVEVATLGVESFAASSQSCIGALPEAEKEGWFDLIERTASTPEGIASADHFLFIGQKKGGG